MSGWGHVHIQQNEKAEPISCLVEERYPNLDGVIEDLKEMYHGVEDLPYRIYITTANDTSNSGKATIYEPQLQDKGFVSFYEDNVFEGYDGANGADVRGKIKDKYDVDISLHWECYDMKFEKYLEANKKARKTNKIYEIIDKIRNLTDELEKELL